MVGRLAVAHVRCWNEVGDRAAPRFVSTTNLSLALGDMDAQVVNVPLVAARPDLGLTRQRPLDIYDDDRPTVQHQLAAGRRTGGIRPDRGRVGAAVLDRLGR
ncbi:hypothetical protein OG555_11725 [Kribbella sp. NBC_01484]|uniref:hypothetical protein n=1 Tax=Kribbella sp. NBC_01484 TaxID=2903579 RepID=UPI002E2FE4F0|nr:hypothetical protein [Kribbella sp. NBC_01484]